MEKFNKVTEPTELEFFSIDPDGNGGKEIHIGGYVYASDTDFGEGLWRNVEFSFCIVPLDEFIKNYAEDEDGEYINNIEGEIKQYIGDHTDEEIVEIINSYFDGNPADYTLTYGEITEDTPCGNYCFEF
jgi:hypothetical protein